jgi:hypothetical protein
MALAARGGQRHEQHSLVHVLVAQPLASVQDFTELPWPSRNTSSELIDHEAIVPPLKEVGGGATP